MKTFFGAIAVLLALCAPLAQAEDLSKPLLLVAKPTLRGPYSHTALLVIPLGDKHIGFILNRATQMTMATAFPDHVPSKKVVDPIYFGGPEAADALFALVRHDPGEAGIRMFGDLYMTGNRASIDRIIEQTPNEARYFAGFVGWMPEELAAELAAGFWYVGPPDVKEVFRKDTSGMWEELVERLGKGQPMRPGPGEKEARRGTQLAALAR
ncbi:MAG: YqgE/AlgH family protein [Clostridia bacterium]